MKRGVNIDIWQRWGHGPVLLIILLAALAFTRSAVHGEALNYDDERYISQNKLIERLDAHSVATMFTTYFDGHYHPLTLLSLALDRQVWDNAVKGHHSVNWLLHLINALMVYLVLMQLFQKPWLAFGVSLLFVLHPMNVESYAWMTERKNLLYSAFFLGAMWAYLRYLDQRNRHFLILCFAFFALSILSKAQAITLLPVLLLIDFLRRRSFRSPVIYYEKIPFFVVSVALVLITANAQAERWGELNTSGYQAAEKLILGATAFAQYLAKGAVPLGLSAYYPYPSDVGQAISWQHYLAIPVVLLFVLFLGYALRKRDPILIFGLSFFLINIVLMLKVLDVPYGNYYMANRYNYLPLIGLLCLVVYGLKWMSALSRIGVVIPVLILGMFYGAGANARISVWQNSVNLWSDVIASYPEYAHAYNMRALGRIAASENLAAMADFEKLIEIKPEFKEAYVNLAILYFRMNRLEEAWEILEGAQQKFPEDDRLFHIGATVQMKLNKPAEALRQINRAMELIDENKDEYRLTRARILIDLRRMEEAREELTRLPNNTAARQLLKSIQEHPEEARSSPASETAEAESLVSKATDLAKQGHMREAIELFNEAVERDPQSKVALINRGSTFGRTGNFKLALKDFKAALAIDPADPQTFYLLGMVYRDMGQREEACQHFGQAVNMGFEVGIDIQNYCRG